MNGIQGSLPYLVQTTVIRGVPIANRPLRGMRQVETLLVIAGVAVEVGRATRPRTTIRAMLETFGAIDLSGCLPRAMVAETASGRLAGTFLIPFLSSSSSLYPAGLRLRAIMAAGSPRTMTRPITPIGVLLRPPGAVLITRK